MNSQFLPGSTEFQNRLSQDKLLREARKARGLRKAARRLGRRLDGKAPFSFTGSEHRRPNILEPAVAAPVTVVLALQAAALVTIRVQRPPGAIRSCYAPAPARSGALTLCRYSRIST